MTTGSVARIVRGSFTVRFLTHTWPNELSLVLAGNDEYLGVIADFWCNASFNFICQTEKVCSAGNEVFANSDLERLNNGRGAVASTAESYRYG